MVDDFSKGVLLREHDAQPVLGGASDALSAAIQNMDNTEGAPSFRRWFASAACSRGLTLGKRSTSCTEARGRQAWVLVRSKLQSIQGNVLQCDGSVEGDNLRADVGSPDDSSTNYCFNISDTGKDTVKESHPLTVNTLQRKQILCETVREVRTNHVDNVCTLVLAAHPSQFHIGRSPVIQALEDGVNIYTLQLQYKLLTLQMNEQATRIKELE